MMGDEDWRLLANVSDAGHRTFKEFYSIMRLPPLEDKSRQTVLAMQPLVQVQATF